MSQDDGNPLAIRKAGIVTQSCIGAQSHVVMNLACKPIVRGILEEQETDTG